MPRLYLVRHGEALSEDVDPARSLSEPGKAEVKKLATLLAVHGVRVARVFHSGKARARQTAEIYAEHLAPGAAPEQMEGLGPMDPVAPVAAMAAGLTESAMLVGHLPFMGKLLSLLATGSEEHDLVVFDPGGAACLERLGGRWALRWFLAPSFVRRQID